MNTLWIGGLLVGWLVFSYRWYGGRIDRRLLNPSDDRPPPSQAQRDGVDYDPARAPVLFGHHFSSIAGAGPIVGPLIGVTAFGWLPALIWIALGSVFVGAIHDYVALMSSVRNRGRSVGQLADQHLGRRARIVLSLFLWMALVLVVAVFGVITAQTLARQPQIVLPTLGLIPLAMLFGGGCLRRGVPLGAATALFLAALAALVYTGTRLPLSLPAGLLGLAPEQAWFWLLMLYCLFASVLPVWVLLQPRDYLSTWILYLGLGGGFLGLLAARPALSGPAWVGFHSVAQGPLWPMLFVTIACGAVSGFHSLVASGTTSKQLARESDGRRIGYGAMLVEAALAGLVVIIAAGALAWDASPAPAAGSLQQLMGTGGGPIVAFAHGFSRLVDPLPGPTAAAGLFFGMLMLNAFVITTLDTSTRLARFLVQELAAGVPIVRGRAGATLLTIAAAAWLGASDSYTAIWPVFGAANQLVAALALIVVSAWLVGMARPRLYTLLPALFMLATSIGALVYQGAQFLKQGKGLLAGISLGLVALALFIAWEARWLLARPGASAAAAGKTFVRPARSD